MHQCLYVSDHTHAGAPWTLYRRTPRRPTGDDGTRVWPRTSSRPTADLAEWVRQACDAARGVVTAGLVVQVICERRSSQTTPGGGPAASGSENRAVVLDDGAAARKSHSSRPRSRPCAGPPSRSARNFRKVRGRRQLVRRHCRGCVYGQCSSALPRLRQLRGRGVGGSASQR